MAGRGKPGPGQPKAHEVRQAARLKRHCVKLATADSPSKQIGAVCDHLRAALAYVAPADADRIAADTISALRRSIRRAEEAEANR